MQGLSFFKDVVDPLPVPLARQARQENTSLVQKNLLPAHHMKQDKGHQALFFPTVIISDLHLGKSKVVEAERLLEFLENVNCETLILNGDIIDGWYLERHKHRPFPEMHARILDAINKKAANGTKVIYIPGNHDWRLRYKTAQETKTQSKARVYPKFNNAVSFGDFDGRDVEIEFKSDMNYIDPNGRKIRVTHGDEFDSDVVTYISKLGDVLYEGSLYAHAAAIYLQRYMSPNGKHFSLSQFLKKYAKEWTGVIDSFERAAKNLPPGIDALAAGHIHFPTIQEGYYNSGDWIDNCTAIAHDKMGRWRTIDWMEVRKEFDYNGYSPFSIDQPNTNADMRDITNRQIRLIHRLWAGRNRSKIVNEIADRREKFAKKLEKHGKDHPKTQKAAKKLAVARSRLFPKPV